MVPSATSYGVIREKRIAQEAGFKIMEELLNN